MQIPGRTVGRLLVRAMLLGGTLAIATKAATAQESTTLAPRAVASQFLNAVTAGDWPTVIRLTDDASLWEYANGLRQTFRVWSDGTPEKLSVDAILARDSLMPRVVAEYQVSQFERSSKHAIPELLGFLAGVERPAQVDSLDDGELYVRSLRAKQVGYQQMLGRRRAGCTGEATSSVIREPTRTVRGVAILSETEAIALYEEKNTVLGSPRIWGGLPQLALRRTKLGWRVIASENLLTGGGASVFVSVMTCGSR